MTNPYESTPSSGDEKMASSSQAVLVFLIVSVLVSVVTALLAYTFTDTSVKGASSTARELMITGLFTAFIAGYCGHRISKGRATRAILPKAFTFMFVAMFFVMTPDIFRHLGWIILQLILTTVALYLIAPQYEQTLHDTTDDGS